MFATAAERLAAEVRDEDLAAGMLFPRPSEIRRVATGIAEAVVRQAREDGVGKNISDRDIPDVVKNAMWDPMHPRAVPV